MNEQTRFKMKKMNQFLSVCTLIACTTQYKHPLSVRIR